MVKRYALAVCCVLNRGPTTLRARGTPAWASRTERSEGSAFLVPATGKEDFEEVCGRPRVAVSTSG